MTLHHCRQEPDGKEEEEDEKKANEKGNVKVYFTRKQINNKQRLAWGY